MNNHRTIWIGWEPREQDAYQIAFASLVDLSPACPPIYPVKLDECRAAGLYTRPTEQRDGRLWDVISEAPMATEFAISRFLVPELCRRAGITGWALFMDCDMLARDEIHQLFDLADPAKAVMCVQHQYGRAEGFWKMDQQIQTAYDRKNWSSVMLFNLDHPANDALTIDLVNTVPGRNLHGFCWLADDLIGALSHNWNHLVGVDSHDPLASLVHFTLGVPSMPGYENCEFADEWREYLA